MTALRDEIVALVRAEGPIPVARYMELALGHPRLGYYTTRDPLGRAGDFTTAPEISQMFGELIGLWLAQVWADMGSPPRVLLAEAGPGRGTLMADALRAAKALPAFRQAVELHLVEISLVLREAQARTLAASGVTPTWHAAMDTLPTDAPLLLIANEFLDALPIRQFQAGDGRWFERLVGERDGALVFGLGAEAEAAITLPASDGDVLEVSPAAIAVVRAIARRLAGQGGAALFVDYGHARSGFGDTLQAMRAHAFADPLESPGEADLTAHVDFAALARAARAEGAAVHGPVTQGVFLTALGLEARAARLTASAPAKAETIASQRDRLIDVEATGMGHLFKVLALMAVDAPEPPGFR